MNERLDPPYVAGEREMLEAWLDFHRATLAWKCDELAADQLREPAVPPSPLTLLGLVRHMTEVERGWFQEVFEGDKVPELYCTEGDTDGDFHGVADVAPADVLERFRAECEKSRRISAGAESLDAIAAAKRRGEDVSLRWILVHMIEEYARHNGHADLLRERIDGRVGD
jgi:uncharacterized damage-inducible protein DinB